MELMDLTMKRQRMREEALAALREAAAAGDQEAAEKIRLWDAATKLRAPGIPLPPTPQP